MKKKIINIILLLLIYIMIFSGFSYATQVNVTNTTDGKFHTPEALKVPEINVNLKIENLTRGCKVYLLLSENLIRYNMQKFVDNNLENPYAIQAQEARTIKEFLDSSDYLGYIEHLREAGFEVDENEIELRHYCFCLGDSEVVGYINHNKVQYIQIAIELNDENEFKLIMKDYLTKYDIRDTKFMIDEYGSITYIDLENIQYSVNPEQTNITECNINHTFINTQDFESIEMATKVTYLIIYVILMILALVILVILVKRHIKKKQEIEERKFWKKKLTKEEKKEEKKQQKEAQKAAKKEKNKKKNK